jgi:secreted trypsin-like serine protease
MEDGMATGLRTLFAATALAALLAPAAQARQARIYNGTPAATGDVPFQVALVVHGRPAADSQYCGGTIRDDRHVITAAHCVFNVTGSGQAIRPDQLDVLAGTADLEAEASAQRRPVAAVTFDPRFDRETLAYDQALLTLAEPLVPSDSVEAIDLVAGADWAGVNNVAGTPLQVSGWGVTESGAATTRLRRTEVPLVPDAGCNQGYAPRGIVQPLMVCAGDGVRDSCFGDSGGPLALDVDSGPARSLRLAGIVSFGGQYCADPLRPGVYTEVDAPAIRTFLEEANPSPAPLASAPPDLTGTARVGEVLRCSTGAWTGSPSFRFQFVRTAGAATLPLTAPGGQAEYAVGAADAGERIGCIVEAANAGGYGVASSALSAPVAVAALPAAPAPDPSAAAPASPPRVVAARDTIAPVARITRLGCRGSRCTLEVLVRDAGFSRGIRGIDARVVSTYRTRCRRGGRRVACTRIRARTLRAVRVAAAAGAATAGSARFRIVGSGLAAGRHAFALRALDVAGNRQAIATRRAARTR